MQVEPAETTKWPFLLDLTKRNFGGGFHIVEGIRPDQDMLTSPNHQRRVEVVRVDGDIPCISVNRQEIPIREMLVEKGHRHANPADRDVVLQEPRRDSEPQVVHPTVEAWDSTTARPECRDQQVRLVPISELRIRETCETADKAGTEASKKCLWRGCGSHRINCRCSHWSNLPDDAHRFTDRQAPGSSRGPVCPSGLGTLLRASRR